MALGRVAEGEAYGKEILESISKETDDIYDYFRASVYYNLKDKNNTLMCLANVFKTNRFLLGIPILYSKDFSAYWNDPEFKGLVKKMFGLDLAS